MLPRMYQDRAAFCFLVACVISVYVFDIVIVLPALGYQATGCCLQALCGLHIVLNIYWNLILMMKTDTTIRGVMLPSASLKDWNFCSICESNTPPRTNHCGACGRCILRRDHHCIFTGCCVGLKNFRHFMFLLFYLFVGCAYASLLNNQFIWNRLGGLNLVSVLNYLFPFLFWFLGYMDFPLTIWTFLSVVSFLGMVFIGVLFYWHLALLLRNQTTPERNRRISKYDLGWRQNIIENLGFNWYLALLLPSLECRMPSDGLHFMTKQEFAFKSRKTK